MIAIDDLIAQLSNTHLKGWVSQLPQLIANKLNREHGDLAKWQTALDNLPPLATESIELIREVAISGKISQSEQYQLEQALRQLSPWRKGPFNLFGITIDTEWHSDWKWNRLIPHLDLSGKRILDVGCGNGYYAWRMLGAGAQSVIGIDPSLLFMCQFLAIKKYLPHSPVWFLPFTLEDFPSQTEIFDNVFSMGVIYHRRSPIDHLIALKDCLNKGGELVLETLIVEGDAQQVLVPTDRYAQMRNVWFIPSVAALEIWLKRVGFSEINCVDISQTTIAEQRTTSWMTFKSLPDFLDPTNRDLTVEGLPAPKRAILLARKL